MSGHESRGSDVIAPKIAAQRCEPAAPLEQDAEPGEWVPEFAGQRPPFEKGNEAAMRHGAKSPRKIEEVARRVSDELAERFPLALDYPETLTALARVESVTRLLLADIISNGVHGKDGRKGVVARYLSAERTGAMLRKSLGMTPESEASVARDRAAAAASTVDVMAELVRQGQATRARLDAAGTGSVTPAPPELSAFGPEAVTEHNARED